MSSETFCKIVGLQLAISELIAELSIDTIEQNPRTVFMALRGLQSQGADLVMIAKNELAPADSPSP